MRFTDMVYRKANEIAWLTINRPEVYHAVRGKTSNEAEHTATVAITAQPAGGGAPLALQAPATPILDDFAPGFTRWLRTCRITADLTATGIRGQMPADATAAQLLAAMGRASDMIDQRFSLYTESILT